MTYKAIISNEGRAADHTSTEKKFSDTSIRINCS